TRVGGYSDQRRCMQRLREPRILAPPRSQKMSRDTGDAHEVDLTSYGAPQGMSLPPISDMFRRYMKNDDSAPWWPGVLRGVLSTTPAHPGHCSVAQGAEFGGGDGWHVHDYWEVYVTLGKELMHQTGPGPPRVLPPRQMLLIPPNRLHRAVHELPYRVQPQLLM